MITEVRRKCAMVEESFIIKESEWKGFITSRRTDSISNADNLYPPTFIISALVPDICQSTMSLQQEGHCGRNWILYVFWVMNLNGINMFFYSYGYINENQHPGEIREHITENRTSICITMSYVHSPQPTHLTAFPPAPLVTTILRFLLQKRKKSHRMES